MNLRFVEAFYWVVTLKSVSRAAVKLCITQSAMSSRVSTLEDELGVLLMDRSDKQFRLTAAGMRFFSHAKKLLALQSEIQREMSAVGGGNVASIALRIGVIESVLHSWLIDWIVHIRKSSPEFELELTVETTPVLIEHVRRGALDLIFAALPTTGDGLRTQALPSMEMTFVGHTQYHEDRIYSLSEIASTHLMTFQRGSQPHTSLMDMFFAAKLEPVRVHNISSISAMVQLVEGGLGVATLPLAAVVRLAHRLPLKVIQCDVPLAPLPLHASYREDPTSLAAQNVLAEMLAFAQTFSNEKPRT